MGIQISTVQTARNRTLQTSILLRRPTTTPHPIHCKKCTQRGTFQAQAARRTISRWTLPSHTGDKVNPSTVAAMLRGLCAIDLLSRCELPTMEVAHGVGF